MKKLPQSNDIWIVNYWVPHKDTNNLQRPFLIIKTVNKKIYGIPLTSYSSKNFKPDHGDTIFKHQSLHKESIIKPYRLVTINIKFLIKKIGVISTENSIRINEKIIFNSYDYLSMTNINSIIRENLIETQFQKITKINNEVIKLQSCLLEMQNQLEISKLNNEFYASSAEKIINDLKQKLKKLQNQIEMSN